MNAERSRDLKESAQRWGAESVAAVIGSAGRTFASRLRSSAQHSSRRSQSPNLSLVASFRAQLRLARRQKVELRVMSSLAGQFGVAVASSSVLFHHRSQS